jgi:hypothetical protein
MAQEHSGLLETARSYGISVEEQGFLDVSPMWVDRWLQGNMTYACREASVWVSRDSVSTFLLAPVLLCFWRRGFRELAMWRDAPLGDGSGEDEVVDYCFTLRVPWEQWPEGPCGVVLALGAPDALDAAWVRCLAGLRAAQRYNGAAEPVLHGCATDGRVWQFGRLSGQNLVRNPGEYRTTELGRLCAAWWAILFAARQELSAGVEDSILRLPPRNGRGCGTARLQVGGKRSA